MKYLAFIVAEGMPAPEDLKVIQREIGPWVEEMDGRGVRVFGRELDLPETAATVKVRNGETLVTDGPYMETKEFIAGFDLLECSDLDEAIEVMAKHPCSRFQSVEIRPFAEGLRLDETSYAFGRAEDAGSVPYCMFMWMGGEPAEPYDGQALMDEGEKWRVDMEQRGLQVMGNALESTESATMVRVRDGKTLISDGPFIETKEFIAGIDVVYAKDREQAIELTAANPISRYHSIEIRPFYVG